MKYILTTERIENFRRMLMEEEKSAATVQKYLKDVQTFRAYLGDSGELNKELVIRYKEKLTESYALSSVNLMLVALNGFFKRMGWHDCVVRCLKVQKETFRDRSKELTRAEYLRLLRTAKGKGKKRLYYLMQTLCATGIRVSELAFITVESLKNGHVRVRLKGKTRTVLIPEKLCRELLKYAREEGIKSGSLFVTASGKPLDRSNILHEMKSLCEEANVDRSKVFPHNLRHLFACTYYSMEKDLCRLADLLGHSSINTTRIYTLVSGEEQSRQLEEMELIL